MPPQTPLQSFLTLLKHTPSQPRSLLFPLQTPHESTLAVPPHT